MGRSACILIKDVLKREFIQDMLIVAMCRNITQNWPDNDGCGLTCIVLIVETYVGSSPSVCLQC